MTGSTQALALLPGLPGQYLLTTNISPAVSGTIAANPSSAAGYYNPGTPVQLTATPASGCTFVNWTGALSGAANPDHTTPRNNESENGDRTPQCKGPVPVFRNGYKTTLADCWLLEYNFWFLDRGNL